MNDLIMALCYLAILVIVYIGTPTKKSTTHAQTNEFYYVPIIDNIVDESFVDEVIDNNSDKYDILAGDIINIFNNGDIPNKRERIVELLREMVEVGDTGSFLDEYQDIHSYIFQSTA